MEFLILVVIGLLVIAAATTLEPRLGLAAPLVLVVAGIGASLLPFIPTINVEPEWILAGVLPPLYCIPQRCRCRRRISAVS